MGVLGDTGRSQVSWLCGNMHEENYSPKVFPGSLSGSLCTLCDVRTYLLIGRGPHVASVCVQTVHSTRLDMSNC